MQDTLIEVLQHHELRTGAASLTTWATAILKHKVADWYRSSQRRKEVQFDAGDGALTDAIDALYTPEGAYAIPIASWQQPENREEQRQMMALVERCMSHLPRTTGRVFLMREWLGFETREIAERLGLSADNCRQLLHRARMGLRGCVEHGQVHGRQRQ